jgi:hypothetical protein
VGRCFCFFNAVANSLKVSFKEMEDSIMEQSEKTSFLDKAVHIGEQVVEMGDEAKTAASHAFEDAVTGAKRFAKRSRYAAEDVMEDAAHRVKRDPLRSEAWA